MILSDSADKVLFGILELDVRFLRDSLHSSYPMVFCRGLLSLFFTLLLSLVKFFMATWLFVDVSMVHVPKSVRDRGPRARFSYSLHSFGYDSGITAAAMYIVMIDEIFRMLGYFLSRWAKLIAMCNFVNFRNRWLKYVIVNTPARYGERTIVIHQHAFLQTFSSSISGWKIFSCILERNQNARMVWSEGKTNDSTAKNVKAAVIQALHSMDLEGHLLSRDLPLPHVSDRAERYWLACLAEVPTCSRIILVWHIATSLCEIKLANDHKINLTTMSRSSSFLVDEKALTDELQKAYTVSNCLSRVLMKCSVIHSFQSIYDKLMEKKEKALVPSKNGLNLSGNILQQGAILAKALIDEECQECRWEILSDVWVHLLVHIAPSSDAAALAEDLISGVEFVTAIWALFCHCGIEKSELWQQQKSANFRNNTPVLDHLIRAVMCLPMFRTQSALVHLLLDLQKFMK
uniref:DUF4220 domain-containing protein n=1 Tax=Oryza nivara TaxID=4536 RepID=A0A0E0J4C3_ORYNI